MSQHPPSDTERYGPADLNAYQQYLLDISTRERLTDEQGNTLLQHLDQIRRGERPQEEGRHIAHQLIEGSLRLVVYIAMRHYTAWAATGGTHGLSRDDLIQVGNVALVECVQRCMTHEHTIHDFSAYAAAYIRCSIRDARRRNLPLSVSKQDWHDAVENGTAHLCTALSLDAVPDGDEGEGPLSDRIAASAEVGVPLSIYEKKRECVAQLLATLTEQEQHIMRLRYGLDEEDQRTHTHQEIGDQVGCSSSTCLNLERRIVQALRDGTPLRSSSEYYSATEATQALSICADAFRELVNRGVIHRYYPSGSRQQGIYQKTEIDILAQEYQRLAHAYYTTTEVAALLSLDRATINKWTRAGKLTCFQMPGRDNYGGLFLKEDIDRIVHQQEEALTLYYTTEETTALLGIGTRTVQRWVREGRLTRHHHPELSRGGYLKEDIDRMARQQEEALALYYTTEETAALLGIATRTVHMWVREGWLTRHHHPELSHVGYLKEEVDTIARFLKKRQASATNVTPLYEEECAYAQ